MINFDDATNETKTKHNPKWPYSRSIVGGSELGKTNTLLNLINKQPDID